MVLYLLHVLNPCLVIEMYPVYFHRYYFGRCSVEPTQLVPFPYSQGRSIGYSDRLHDFSGNIPRCYKNVYVNGVSLRTSTLWNSMPIECFSLTYDLNGFKSRIKRHLLIVDSFYSDFLYVWIFFVLFLYISMPFSEYSALPECMYKLFVYFGKTAVRKYLFQPQDI